MHYRCTETPCLVGDKATLLQPRITAVQPRCRATGTKGATRVSTHELTEQRGPLNLLDVNFKAENDTICATMTTTMEGD